MCCNTVRVKKRKNERKLKSEKELTINYNKCWCEVGVERYHFMQKYCMENG